MPALQGDAYQAGFARRWGHIQQPHVRALAWLLEAPDLLDAAAPQWHGQVATLGPVSTRVADWLAGLDADPAPLLAALGERPSTRLGKYAEQLMAFYFTAQGQLHVHGLQVRASPNDTVGEFDFLLRAGAGLHHLEFATKFYLLDATLASDVSGLIGPNLADTLGAKMRKIFSQQLTLAQHPAAQALLPLPVTQAQALVKGWLFYPPQAVPGLAGIAAQHNHGYWLSREHAGQLQGDGFVLLPRLAWLAPARLPLDTTVVLNKQELLLALDDHQAQSGAPVMVAHLTQQGNSLVEQRRGFVVPDQWSALAAERRRSGALPV